MPSDDFMERADDEREMTAIADDIDDLDDDRDLDDNHADEEDTDTVTFASLGLPEEDPRGRHRYGIPCPHSDSGCRHPAAAGTS